MLNKKPSRETSFFCALREASQWYATLNSDSVSEQQRQSWRSWLQASSENRQAWQRIESASRRFDGLSDSGGQPAVSHTLQSLGRRRLSRRQSMKGLLLGAAIVGGGGWLAGSGYRPADLLADHRSGIGEIKQLTLDDGTQTWLGAASSMDVSYSRQQRYLQLHRGRVMVAGGDDPRALVVDAPQGRVQAQDARFTVAEKRDACVVSVFAGQVSVLPDRGREVRVPAGQQLVWSPSRAASLLEADPAYRMWVNHVLVARHRPLGDLLDELSDYRHGVLHVAPAVRSLKVTGVFPSDDTDKALQMLAASLPIEVTVALPWWVSVGPASV